jgi:hypothetical protein
LAGKRAFVDLRCRIVKWRFCPLTLREWAGMRWPMIGKRLAIEFFLVLVTGLVLGLIGPFGTFAMETAPRLAYWMTFGFVGYAVFRPLIIIADWLSELTGIPVIISVGLALLIAAMPVTVLIAGLMRGFDIGAILRWDGIGLLYFQVWLIGFLTNGLFRLIFRNVRQPAETARPIPSTPASVEPTPTLAAPEGTRFADRLPVGFGPLIALRGEDHYVRAFAADRETMVLIRLRDAIAELGDSGTQVHRSWWVARDGVDGITGGGRDMMLQLTNGKEAPVSRDHAARLKAMGWIDGQGRWVHE